MKDNKTMYIVLLLIVVVGAFGYIGYSEFKKSQLVEQQAIYQEGAQMGYQQAIMQLVQQAVTCKEVPINVQNQTINIVAVECLKIAAQQYQEQLAAQQQQQGTQQQLIQQGQPQQYETQAGDQ